MLQMHSLAAAALSLFLAQVVLHFELRLWTNKQPTMDRSSLCSQNGFDLVLLKIFKLCVGGELFLQEFYLLTLGKN